MANCKEEKKIIRQRISLLRDSLSKEVIAKNSRLIEKKVFELEEFKQSRLVMFFATFRSEPDTFSMIERALKTGKRVALPKAIKAQSRELIPVEVRNLKDDLKTGLYGIQEPYKDERLLPEDIDIVFVPGIAFDIKGRRIGYGGGYYDNFLKKILLEKCIGLAYKLQVLKEIPGESHDLRVKKIVTEKGVLTC